MSQNKDESKTIKAILSTDYHIPGISPPFYLAVCLLAVAVVVAYVIWSPFVNVNNGDWASAIAVFVIFAVSALSTTIQRILHRFRRK
jgi:high-affinity Fe2+/Pb2+ permease